MKRKINMIVIHCSASDYVKHDDIEVIRAWHKARGFKDVGYHYFIKKNGTIQEGRPEDQNGAHAKGYNGSSIGICLSGNLVEKFTDFQFKALSKLIYSLKKKYDIKYIVGHRDLSVDLNGDGYISKYEWIKTCPNFELKGFLETFCGNLVQLYEAFKPSVIAEVKGSKNDKKDSDAPEGSGDDKTIKETVK